MATRRKGGGKQKPPSQYVKQRIQELSAEHGWDPVEVEKIVTAWEEIEPPPSSERLVKGSKKSR